MIKILFVCHGNICRSTMAQSIMTYLVREAGLEHVVEVDSAAVSREEIGNGMYPPAKSELRRRGIPEIPHRARQVTLDDYAFYDVLVCMDRSNVRLLSYCIGSDKEGKVRMLMDYTDQPGEVSDPWYTDRFDEAFDDIYLGCSEMLHRIKQNETL